MGSRAVVVICRDEDVARRRFGVVDEGIGACYTRTGRRFFDDAELEQAFLGEVLAAVDGADLFDALESDWVVLDCELMPWSAKAQELLRRQYAAVGAAGRAAFVETLAALESASGRDGVAPLIDGYRARAEDVARFVESYRRYCWPVSSLADLKLAPFHLLASEGGVHVDKTHAWHMEQAAKLVAAGGDLLQPTAHIEVDVTDAESAAEGAAWWTDLTERGGEGMVVKPLDFVVRGRRGLVQPALKTRGREYLRIIYGPEYTEPANLERLRSRGLGRKRSLAAREFALGIEALERFVREEPLRRVHECVFGVLALESEPVDPRL